MACYKQNNISTTDCKLPTNGGFVTLVSVLAIGAVGVAVVVSSLLLGVGNSRTSFAHEQSNQAKALASACAEEALQQIREATSFTGSDNLSLGQGNCSYTVTSQGGQNRTVIVSADVGTVVRKIEIAIGAIQPLIEISHWREVE